MAKKRIRMERRSQCPINLTVELLGDRWTLMVIRDIMFGNRRHYLDLLRLSEEGIASNILADRLSRLVSLGLLTRTANPTHKQKAIYSLTEASIELLPILSEMMAWGRKHIPGTKLKGGGIILEAGGQRMWKAFATELKAIHLGAPPPRRWIFFPDQAALHLTGARNQGRGLPSTPGVPDSGTRDQRARRSDRE